MKLIPSMIVSTIALMVATTSTGYATARSTDSARIDKLEQRVNQLSTQASCQVHGMAVTKYHDPKTGLTYLAPTKNVKLRRVWVTVISPTCVPKTPTTKELAWHF